MEKKIEMIGFQLRGRPCSFNDHNATGREKGGIEKEKGRKKDGKKERTTEREREKEGK